MKSVARKIMLVSVLSVVSNAVHAQTPVQEPPPPVVTSTGSSSQVESRLVSSFSSFAGSEDNARSLVTGLRQGSEITLTSPGSPSAGATTTTTNTTTTTTGTTFVPATRPMGYGNVRIALSLAQEQLAQAGITQPTPRQIQTALMGGTITTTGTTSTGGTVTTSTQYQGVLQMRADGMGWGQIANSMGVKLGAVMSGRTVQPAPTPTQTSAATTTASGVTTATGSASTTTKYHGRSYSASGQQNARAGAGIVNASGGSSAGVGVGARTGSGAGVVTGANVTAGNRASATGQANGKGLARP